MRLHLPRKPSTTTHSQDMNTQNMTNLGLNDPDRVCENTIKQCQKENGRLMVSTSNYLKRMYGDEQVIKVIRRLQKRRDRANNYQNKDSKDFKHLLDILSEKMNGNG